MRNDKRGILKEYGGVYSADFFSSLFSVTFHTCLNNVHRFVSHRLFLYVLFLKYC